MREKVLCASYPLFQSQQRTSCSGLSSGLSLRNLHWIRKTGRWTSRVLHSLAAQWERLKSRTRRRTRICSWRKRWCPYRKFGLVIKCIVSCIYCRRKFEINPSSKGIATSYTRLNLNTMVAVIHPCYIYPPYLSHLASESFLQILIIVPAPICDTNCYSL